MRTLVLGGAAFLLVAFSMPVRADWAVKRQSNDALLAQTARTLEARPYDGELARRLVRLAGKPALERLLAALALRASGPISAPETVLAYAQLLLADGKAVEAAPQFERVVRATSASDAAREARAATQGAAFLLATYLGWAEALRATGDRPGALTAYWRALDIEKRAPQRRRLLLRLVSLTGDPTGAESELAARRALVALDPQSDAATLALVEALARAGRPGEGAQVMDARLATLSASGRSVKVALLLRAATLHEMAGEEARAAAIVADVLRSLPPSAVARRREVWTHAAEIARRQGTLPDMARRLGAADARRGPAEWEMLSALRDELGDLEGALEAARRAFSLEPRNLDMGRRVAALLDRLGRQDEVTTQLAALARLASADPRFTVDLIERQFRLGRKEDADGTFDHALNRFASDAPALGQLAALAGRWSEKRRAIEAWTKLLRLSPRDEMAILGLGEEQFQSRNKELAIRTWQALREGRTPRADGHARLAEVLIEHDLLEEATSEVLRAQALEPDQPRHRRLMAQIFERQRRPDAAIDEWDRVLAMNSGPNRASERREARSRILGLLGREGRARLDDKIRKLRLELNRDPSDRETALFLAEAQLRSDDLTGAIETLRATVARDGALAPADGAEAKVEVMLALVRLLRQTRQLDEAVRLLDQLAQRSPTHAREAHIQIADIELGRYEDRQALEHANSAAQLAPDDGHALIRVAEVQERAGEVEAALASYRRAFSRDADPTAAMALARLLTRRGATREASAILRGALGAASDEETISETGHRAIELEEYLGTLGELERVVAGLVFSTQNGAAYRRLLVDIYRRMVPALYRAPGESADAAESRARIAQHGLRPLLELVTDGDRDPERGLVELLGMLGNGDATPALARLAQGQGPPTSGVDLLLRNAGMANNEVQLTAIIALGRLADGRGRAVLENLLSSSDATLRVAAVWALGRLSNLEAGELLAASTHSHLEVAGFAYLGLGRTRDPRWGDELTTAALDASLPLRLRRAAALALGLSGNRSGVGALLSLVDSGQDDLARAAAVAIGAIGNGDADADDVLPGLFERALLESGWSRDDDGPALAGIDRLVKGMPLEDEAKAIEGTRLDLDAMLSVLVSSPAPVDRTAAWVGRAADVEKVLVTLLDGDHMHALRALEALDTRDDGVGLGPLAPSGRATVSPAVTVALRQVAAVVSTRVAILARDRARDPHLRALALRVAAKIGDARLTPSMIVAALSDAPTELEDAAAFALAGHLTAHPDARGAIIKALAPLLADATSWPRRRAAAALMGGLGPTARPQIEPVLRDENPFVRSAAVTAYAQLAAGGGSGAGAMAMLALAATDSVAAVRAAAARALVHAGDPAAKAILIRLARDPSDLVRNAATNIEP